MLGKGKVLAWINKCASASIMQTWFVPNYVVDFCTVYHTIICLSTVAPPIQGQSCFINLNFPVSVCLVPTVPSLSVTHILTIHPPQVILSFHPFPGCGRVMIITKRVAQIEERWFQLCEIKTYQLLVYFGSIYKYWTFPSPMLSNKCECRVRLWYLRWTVHPCSYSHPLHTAALPWC